MALTYPLTQPTTIGIEQIELRAVNAVATSQSPFTYKQQIVSHGGQRWEASVTIPSVRRDLAAPWKAMLTGLKGPTGTFLLGDPDYATPRGTVSSCTLTGTAGSDSPTVTMTGTLLAGDYIQLGTGSTAKLHQVLQDQDGDGNLQLWPDLRTDYTDATVTFNSPKGVFRLKESITSWSINNASFYGISFEAVEAITG
jgi:hypothetical protein